MTTAHPGRPDRRRPRADLIDLRPPMSSFREDVLRGLASTPKSIPPKYFYDERGSELFDRITRLPEYYPTRTEISILESRASEIASLLGDRWELVELGTGSARKIRILLEAAGGVGTYLPIDISREHLMSAAEEVAAEFPHIRVVAVCADYTEPVPLERLDPKARRVVFFPGSTIGNLEPHEAGAFLSNLHVFLREGDLAVIGVDLQKDPAVLHAAYNDDAGVTAKFNLNILERINRELAADFDVRRFEHVALYDVRKGRIEMHLRSRGAQQVRVAGTTVSIAGREMIHTENSYKYTRESFGALAVSAGFRVAEVWTDDQRFFSVWVLDPESPEGAI